MAAVVVETNRTMSTMNPDESSLYPENISLYIIIKRLLLAHSAEHADAHQVIPTTSIQKELFSFGGNNLSGGIARGYLKEHWNLI